MKKIIILRGLPASGKTTFAKEWLKEDPEHRIRVNKDELRAMALGTWSESMESFIRTMHSEIISNAMLEQYDIVIDNTNLKARDIDSIVSNVKEFNKWISTGELEQYEVEIKTFFDVPLTTCIERDSKRDVPVGEHTIKRMYYKNRDLIDHFKRY